MVNHTCRNVLLMLALGLSMPALAQQRPENGYDPVAAFAPVSHSPGSAQRSLNGTPGPGYWQNRADNKIVLSLDTASRRVQGQVTIVYSNNSPDTLSYLWLVAALNRFRSDSRESLLTPPEGSRFGVKEYTDGCVIERFLAGQQPADYRVSDNYIRVALAKPLLPGKQMKLEIGYHYTLPESGADYMGVLKTPQGGVYQLSSVFPRMCVYDDLRGWNVLSTQYYVETGSMDMRFTAPANMIVQGTGTLMNPGEVMRPELLQRYRTAIAGDTAMRIRTAGEATTPKGAETLTWHFSEPHAGDGIWAASAAFNWDALGTQLPDGRRIPTMALYPPGSHREWDTIATAMSRILKTYSNQWTPYPYTSAVNIGAAITGVASPGVSVLRYDQSSMGSTIWGKTNHEIGHAWFNLMIAGDSRIGWMCEGQNTFINILNAEALNGPGPFEWETGLQILTMKGEKVPIHTTFGSVPPKDMGQIMYLKPSMAFMLLRNEVLGAGRFDDAFRRYIRSWSFRHPAPHDFFRAMENAAGEDLSWFWRAWFFTDARLDQGIRKVTYTTGSPANGIFVTLVNKLAMPMPVNLLVREFNGKSHRIKLPAQVWEWNDQHTLKVSTTSPVTAVLLDPENRLPDMDRSDNVWIGGGTKLRIDKSVTAQQVIDRYLEAIGGKAQLAQLRSAKLEYRAGPGNAFVMTQRLGSGNASSWSTMLETGHTPLVLKSLQVADSLQFSSFSQPQALTPAEADQLRFAGALFPELRFFETGNKVMLSDSLRLIHGVEAYLVTVTTTAGNTWEYYYDAASGMKVREVFKGQGTPLLYNSKVLSAYEAHDGIKIPNLVTLNEDGTKDEQYELKIFSKS
ncbi:M1 family peptidase [Chitinophaga sp. NPDC101104]|uniref:M1 family peptidase n=1 Tax=Chitinophaga sp. NPDC101104 TaxID=3390561 RepID=UPI003D043EAF